MTRAAESTVFPASYVVYSGAWIQNPNGGSNKILYSRTSSQLLDKLGTFATILGDIDGDGRDDYALSAGGNAGTPFPDGSVVAVSGATGAVLNRFGPNAGGKGYGFQLTAISDRNGDGVADLAVSQNAWPSQTDRQGRVEIVSGSWMASGGVGQRTIEDLTLPGATSSTRLGEALSTADVDGDGQADLVASYRGPVSIEWAAFSGRTGNVMWTKGSSMATTSSLRPYASILEDGPESLALLGTPDVLKLGFLKSGEVLFARAHDGAGVQSTLGVNCPCGVDQPTAGCANSTGSGAAFSVEAGTLSLAAQNLTMATTDMPPFATGILMGGVPSGPSPLGAGYIGLTGFIRSTVAQSNGSGELVSSGDIFGNFAASSSVTPGTMAPMVGVPFAMQMVYRDIACTGVLNVSNAYVVVPRF